MGLARIIEDHRVIITVGSGGVGKTTTAAAISVHAALQGKRVLCLTIDPAKRLANSLGLDEMTTEQQRITTELFEQYHLQCSGELCAMMLDTKHTFDALVRRYASSEEVRDRILNNEIYRYVASSLAGTQEYMAMEKLYEVRKDPTWDLIVLDTPPTTNALDFLDAPERLIDAIDSPAMRWFMQVFEGAAKKGFGLVGTAATVLLKGIAKFTGLEFLEQVASFVAGINDLFGGFRDRATQVADALRSEEVAFVLVTTPDPFAISEAQFFGEKLKNAKMKHEAIVINQVHELFEEPAISEREQIALLTDAFDKDSAQRLYPSLKRALRDEREWATRDRVETKRLHASLGDIVPLIEVPALESDVHDLGKLAKIATFLTIEAA